MVNTYINIFIKHFIKFRRYVVKNKNIYIGISFLILGLIYLTYIFSPLLFRRLFNLWPIFMLISGVILQYSYFDIGKDFLLILSGLMIVIGTMFTINFYINFINSYVIIAIFCLAISASMLNYYIFTKSSDLILPFIFLFIVISIIIFLYPIYKNRIPNFNSNLIVSFLFISIGIYILISNNKKIF